MLPFPAWKIHGCATPAAPKPDAENVEFFPDESTGSHDQAQAAVNLCRECKVRANCLDYALELKIPEGVWGGMTAPERRKIKRRAA